MLFLFKVLNNAFGRVIIRVIMKEIDKINKAHKYLSRIYAKPIDTILVLGDEERGIAIPPKAMMNKYISMIFGEMAMEEQEEKNE